MNTSFPSPYLRGKVYYFKYTDHRGRRIQRSTGCRRKADAQEFIIVFLRQVRNGMDPDMTVRMLLRMYQDPESNPKLSLAGVTESHYSDRHAKHTARKARDLEDLLGKRSPRILGKPVSRVLRTEVTQMAADIVAAHGKCNKSHQLFKFAKSVFNGCERDGLISVSPARGLPDIKYKKVVRHSLPVADLRLVLSHPEVFPSDRARRMFLILASTGLRRSEALAISRTQLKGENLVVDRAYKDDSLKVIGLPKWDKVRVIPLCRIASDCIREAFGSDGGELPLGAGSRELYSWFRAIRTNAARLPLSRPQAWEDLSPHTLRRSLNTNLRLAGVPDLLVAEYMSWEHQSANAVQEGYTELYAENLVPVADAIQSMFDVKGNVVRFVREA